MGTSKPRSSTRPPYFGSLGPACAHGVARSGQTQQPATRRRTSQPPTTALRAVGINTTSFRSLHRWLIEGARFKLADSTASPRLHRRGISSDDLHSGTAGSDQGCGRRDGGVCCRAESAHQHSLAAMTPCGAQGTPPSIPVYVSSLRVAQRRIRIPIEESALPLKVMPT